MTNPTSRKKSNFPAKTTIPTDSTFDFVSGGTNFKIPVADLLTALGVTGTLVQSGAPTGTPVLNKNGSVNGIRNLEPGAGISTAVSPENGITIKHNFANGDSGIDMIQGINTVQPVIPSLQQGAGIDLSLIDNHIVITSTEIVTSTKTILVTVLADFGAPVAGVVTLEDRIQYLVSNDIDFTGVKFVGGNGTVISGANSSVITMSSTDSGVAFSGTDVDWKIERIKLSCVNGQLFDFSSPSGMNLFQLSQTTIICDEIGTIDGYRGIQSGNVSYEITSGGYVFGGTIQAIFFFATIIVITDGDFMDISGATLINSLNVDSPISVALSPTANFLKGSGSSNIGQIATLVNGRYSGAGSILDGITVDDVKWQFLGNSGIPDTRPDALMSLSGNSTETVISGSNTPVKLIAVWTVESDSFFTADTTGRITYNGDRDFKSPIDFSCTLITPSGGSKQATLYVAINGVIVTNTGKQATISSSAAASVDAIWQHNFVTGDYAEVWGENNTDATNIILQQAVGRTN